MLDHENSGLPFLPRSASAEETHLQNASDPKQMGLDFGDFAIDWQTAAPSWSAIFVGALLPVIGAFVAFVLVCWLISRSLSTPLAFAFAAIVSALCFAACLKAASLAASEEKAPR